MHNSTNSAILEIKLRVQLSRVDFTKEVSEIPLWFSLANHVLYTTTVRRPHLYPTWTRGAVIFHVTTERSSLIYRRARYWRPTSCPLKALKKSSNNVRSVLSLQHICQHREFYSLQLLFNFKEKIF